MDRSSPISHSSSVSNRAILEDLSTKLGAGLEQDALAACEALLATEPDHPAGLYGLAMMALRHRAILPALRAIQRAHERDPSEPVYAEILAILYATAGNLGAAAYFGKLSASLGFDAAVQILLPPSLPTFPRTLQLINASPYLHRGHTLLASRCYSDAIGQYELHLAFFPGHIEARRALARSLIETGQPARAVAILAELRTEGLAGATDLSLLGQAYTALGEIGAATICHAEAATAAAAAETTVTADERLAIACARLADAVFDPAQDEASLIAQRRAWGATVEGGERPAAGAAFDGRRVRVGYLAATTADIRDLEVLATVAASSDPQRFEVYLYGYRSIDETANALLRGCHDEWRDISECDAATLAATIEGDEIDLVVDLGGYAAPVHIGALALRPARFQVSWLGNPVTLGLPQIDVELADEADTTDTGTLRQKLPFGLYCYDYFGQSPSGRVRTGALTFGADVALAQLHPDLLAAWAQLLARVPGSVLALRDRGFVTGGLVDRLLELFGAHGIAERIDVINLDAVAFHREVDIVLAPFVAAHPHDLVPALTAGVPVVALAGPGRHRRQASTLLHHIGLDRLIAADAAGYVEIAASLALSDEERQRVAAEVSASLVSSPVFDPNQFAAAFDAALLEIIGQAP